MGSSQNKGIQGSDCFGAFLFKGKFGYLPTTNWYLSGNSSQSHQKPGYNCLDPSVDIIYMGGIHQIWVWILPVEALFLRLLRATKARRAPKCQTWFVPRTSLFLGLSVLKNDRLVNLASSSQHAKNNSEFSQQIPLWAPTSKTLSPWEKPVYPLYSRTSNGPLGARIKQVPAVPPQSLCLAHNGAVDRPAAETKIATGRLEQQRDLPLRACTTPGRRCHCNLGNTGQ